MLLDMNIDESDADRILARAAEIESSKGRGVLSVDELRSIAAEAGFSTEALERAISETLRAPAPAPESDISVTSGLMVTRISATRTLNEALTPDEMIETAHLFTPYFEPTTAPRYSDGSVSWRDSRRIDLEISRVEGGTTIRVEFAALVVWTAPWKKKVVRAAEKLERLARYVRAAGRMP